ncbi:MAG: DUF1385 domain-containing protein [Clostridia bacterium]|nr:DUF1385 domain-containing protein [Clostridia bacterium]
MMRSPGYTAIAVRRLDNKKINVSRSENRSLADKYKFLKWPLIRGVVNFASTLKLSVSTLTKATDMLGLDEAAEEPGKFDKWLEKHHAEKWLMPALTTLSMLLGVGIAVVLFIWLPTFLGKLILGDSYVGGGFKGGILKSLIEGVTKILLFILYIWATAFIPDMKRVYMYHGAEHKSIYCYEKGLELTVENVRGQKRFHPRCGTSFMFFMLLLSIFIGIVFLWPIETVWLRTLLKFPLVLVAVSIGYEFIKYAGRHNNLFVRVLSAPGLWMQRLTTREPDDSMIEVGVASLKCALPDEFPGFYEECKAAADAPAEPADEPAVEDTAAEAPAEEETAPEENAEPQGTDNEDS